MRKQMRNTLGEEVDDFVYESELRLPGSSACTLQLDWDSILFCLWNHPSEASARAAYTQLSATVTYAQGAIMQFVKTCSTLSCR